MRNKNHERVLLSFWLPFRKSNFINLIDKTTKDNLVNKIINFAFDYHLQVEEFDVNLNDSEYNSIFKLQETKQPRVQREYVKKHLAGEKESIQLTGDVKREKKEKQDDIETSDTLTEHRYKLSKKEEDEEEDTKEDEEERKKKKKRNLDVNFSKSEKNNINHLCLRFKFTDDSIKIFDEFKFFEEDKEKFKPVLLKDLEFRLLIDEYGFYFIDTETYDANFFEIDYKMIQLFIKIFFSWDSNRFSLLTVDQKHIIKDGLLFEYDIDNKEIDLDNRKNSHDKIENFFKKIMRVYHYKNFEKRENFDILPSKELVYILDKRNDNELQQKTYNIPFLEYAYELNKNPSKLIEDWILNTDKRLTPNKIKFLYKLFLQDQIEKNAMSVFLEVSTSINYIGQIINEIKKARDNLRILINDTTESVDDSDMDYREEKEELTEEQLARYIEKIFSKIPNLKTIDTFLQEAYYIKVGNYSFVSYIEDSENIATLYQYIKWKNLLDNIHNTALSLETILQVYQNRQSLEELEELRRNELSTSDKNDVRNISYRDRHNILLSKGQEDFIIVFGSIIAFSSFYKDMWESVHTEIFNFTQNVLLSNVLSIIPAIVMLYILKLTLPSIYNIVFRGKDSIYPNFLGVNTIELRSKRKLDLDSIEHEKDHDFTKKINTVIKHIEDNIPEEYRYILQKGRRRILFTRANPRKRAIKIKYIFDEDGENEFFELRILNIKKRELHNKNLKIKFFIVYNFVLKLKKAENDKEFFDIYNNSAKVYFNIGVVGSLKKKKTIEKDEDLIRQRFYYIFLKKFNKS